jgi:hypothetical protein
VKQQTDVAARYDFVDQGIVDAGTQGVENGHGTAAAARTLNPDDWKLFGLV